MNNTKGFTLVELAIVLVIIGVILGGVMKGQQLIVSAKSKRIIRDFQTIQSAYYTFQDLKGYIPGDNPTARTGKVDGSTTEGQFWNDLRDANLFQGSGTENPRNVFGGTMVAGSTSATTAGLAKNAICMSAVPSDSAGSIDRASDDGDPTRGDIHAGTDNTASSATAYTDVGNVTICFSLE